MTLLSISGYAADAWILFTYWLLARGGKARAFHLANAIGCIPLISIEALQHAWPVIPLTATFGVIGAWGLLKELDRIEVWRP